MSIGHKFLTLIALAIIRPLTVGLLGMLEMWQMDEGQAFTNARIIPGIRILHKIESDFQNTQVALLYHILNTEKDRMAEQEKTIAELRKTQKETLASYESFITDEQDRLAGMAEIGYIDPVTGQWTIPSTTEEPLFADEFIDGIPVYLTAGKLRHDQGVFSATALEDDAGRSVYRWLATELNRQHTAGS